MACPGRPLPAPVETSALWLLHVDLSEQYITRCDHFVLVDGLGGSWGCGGWPGGQGCLVLS